MPGEAGAAVHTETAMAPGAGGSHPAADVLGAKLSFLLESLKELEAGRARIVNLFDGLKATHVCPDHVRKLVAALPPPQSDTWEIYRDLLDHIRGFHQTLYFRRPSPPVWDRPIALVVDGLTSRIGTGLARDTDQRRRTLAPGLFPLGLGNQRVLSTA